MKTIRTTTVIRAARRTGLIFGYLATRNRTCKSISTALRRISLPACDSPYVCLGEYPRRQPPFGISAIAYTCKAVLSGLLLYYIITIRPKKSIYFFPQGSPNSLVYDGNIVPANDDQYNNKHYISCETLGLLIYYTILDSVIPYQNIPHDIIPCCNMPLGWRPTQAFVF